MDYATIPGFEKLTKQQLFDMAWKHVVKNGEPAVRDGTCAYDGIGCAAAPFLKEHERRYRGTWGQLVNSNVVPKHHAALIGRMQGCHDDNCLIQGPLFVEAFKADMRMVAEKHGLTAPEEVAE